MHNQLKMVIKARGHQALGLFFMEKQNQGKTSALYIHFPFCASKCHYCNFHSTPSSDTARYFHALNLEVQFMADKLSNKLDSVYIGGGTPSLAKPTEFFKALAPLQLQNRIDQNTEFTIEANPLSLNKPTLSDWRTYGVNRLSIGIQSLQPNLLSWLGRTHNPQQAFSALELALTSGIENISADLMCGIPGLTLNQLEQDLKKLLTFPIKHLSCYLLTLESSHRLANHLPPEDEQQRQLLLVHDILTSHGLRHYEISNFSKPGWHSRHNSTYWSGNAYLGLGPSAHSYNGTNERWANITPTEKYCERLEHQQSAIAQQEKLTAEQLEMERWLLSLRLDTGFPKEWLKTPTQQQKANELLSNGLLESHPTLAGRLRLTPLGFTVSDQIIENLA
jgi:oxygen-independent coproporphyrinogen-3 oxidase